MSNNSVKIRKMVILAMLTAVIILMTFTPLGYLKLPFVEISFLMLPVALGAILLGPVAGAILGTVFGITSFIQCFGASALGAMLLSINPFLTFLVCVPTRILAGWLTGLVFQAIYRAEAKREKKHLLSFGAASLCAPIFNTLFFMGTLTACFYQTDYIQGFVKTLGAANPIMFIILFAGINAAVEIAVGFLVGSVITKAVYNVVQKG